MPMMIHRGLASDDQLSCCIVALLDPAAVPLLREVLLPIQPLFVVVSHGPEPRQRGGRLPAGRQLTRMEIACTDEQVDRIADEVALVLAGTRGRLLKASC